MEILFWIAVAAYATLGVSCFVTQLWTGEKLLPALAAGVIWPVILVRNARGR